MLFKRDIEQLQIGKPTFVRGPNFMCCEIALPSRPSRTKPPLFGGANGVNYPSRPNNRCVGALLQ